MEAWYTIVMAVHKNIYQLTLISTTINGKICLVTMNNCQTIFWVAKC